MKKIFFCFLIIVAAQLSNFIFGAIPAEERAALIALYNSTNGDGWTHNEGWKTPALHTDGFSKPGTEAGWRGITLRADHVDSIRLDDNQLSGTIPAQLGNLSYLRDLRLDRNQLSGSIPSELGNLRNLITLYLYHNQLSGSIPSTLGKLSNLTAFMLSSNQLSGVIPSQLGNLSNLKDLDLYNNQLSGSIPSQLSNLSNLTGLSLEGNKLSGSIPPELGNLTNLIHISLSYNNLSGSIPIELVNLSNLKDLWLNSNQLSGSIPLELGNLRNLETLDLKSNHLSGSIPPELGNLSKLIGLYLSSNRLEGAIPSELGKLGKLLNLELQHNQLCGSIPSELSNLRNIMSLYLDNNQLSGSIPSELCNLGNISFFGLSHNLLCGEIPKNFKLIYSLGWFDVSYNCLSATDRGLRTWLDKHSAGWEAHQDRCVGKNSKISLSHSKLNFDYTILGSFPHSQKISISNSGSGVLNWILSWNSTWFYGSPQNGTGDSYFWVVVNVTGLPPGTYSGELIVYDFDASNSPQPIKVTLNIKASPPFGDFATPMDGSSVCNSIPVTGWALDDIGIASVKIYNGDAYVGDAVFIEGARPDIEAAYPGYPNNNKAGWGYMLLTQFLPGGGNGTYTLTAKAIDIEGNEVTLGSKTINIDNAHATKPFGAVDTPTQGGTASGKNFINYGWALTPQPNTIPVDGSTINVIIDGAVKGHPLYGIYRADIASLFPGYANKDGAIGHYTIDTTKLTNGIHTIAWTVTDNAGNSDGIGSRYFTVQDSEVKEERRGEPSCAPVFDSYSPTFDELISVEIKELERVEIQLGEKNAHIQGYSISSNGLNKLPIGSTLDAKSGTFSWIPGPGFIGNYSLVFILTDANGQSFKKSVEIKIKPKFNN